MKKSRNHWNKGVILTIAALILFVFFTACDNAENPTVIDSGNEPGNTYVAEGTFEEGLTMLENGNYDNAIKEFDELFVKNPNDPEAIIFSTLARLAAIAVDPGVCNLMTDRLGIKNYPGTIDGLLDIDSWMVEYADE